MADVARLNHRHEQIVNWLILNPERSLGECAAAFGYTQAWISQLIHSDMFQARYREACAEVGELAVHTIHNRLSNLTVAAIEKSLEKIETGAATERFLGDTLRTSLQALGYSGSAPGDGNGKAPPINITIQAQALVAARERVAAARAGTTVAKLEGPSTQGVDAIQTNGNGKPVIVTTIQKMLEDDGI